MVEYTILLEGLEVTIGLGIHDHERAAPQRVAVSVWLTCAYDAVPADLIEAVVDYDYLRAGIRTLAAARHIELQETLCEEVARLALAYSGRIVGRGPVVATDTSRAVSRVTLDAYGTDRRHR